MMETPKKRPQFISTTSHNYLSAPVHHSSTHAAVTNHLSAPAAASSTHTAHKAHSKNVPDQQYSTLLQQAIYNTGTNVFVIFAGFCIVALYWVLESFFRPLMWATLCGAFLFPFKSRLTKNVKSWLSALKKSGTPFTLGIFRIPIDILDISSENLIASVYERWRVIAVVSGVFFTLYITYYRAPVDFRQCCGIFFYGSETVSNFISFFSFKWVCGLVLCYFIAVVRLWSPENKQLLSYMAIPLWVLTMFCVIANAGALRLPLAIAFVVLMAVGYYTDRLGQQEASRPNSETELANQEPFRELSFKEGFNKFTSMIRSSLQYTPAIEDETELQDDVEVTEKEPTALNDTNALTSNDTITEDNEEESATEHKSFASSTTADSSVLEPPGVIEITPATRTPTQTSLAVDYGKERSPSQHSELTSQVSHISQVSINKEQVGRCSDKYFIFLFWAVMLVLLWSNVWLSFLPLISLAFRLVKMAVKWLWSVTSSLREQLNSEEMEPMRTWFMQRLDVIVPTPIRGMTKLMLKGDKKVINVLLGSADAIITILLIFLLFVGFVSMSVAVSYQVQKEGLHLVTVTSNLVQNRTYELQWLHAVLNNSSPGNETAGIHSSLDPMIKNIYTLGREWLLTQIAERVSHEPSCKLLQSEAVNVWDSLYESWVTKNATAIAKPNYDGALFSQIKDGSIELSWERLSLDISGLFGFLRENIGIFHSVLESVWILVKGNINVAVNLLLSLLQIILGGGTAILNSCVSMIVFFTTLFYLLASSSRGYKPVEWISGLTFARTGNKFAQAVEDGIGGVFAASLKMAAFYGIYTWLTHTVFGINIVFLPSVFAAVLGAIPFVGTYWAALPAILELSLVHQEIFLAILLGVFHVLPTLVVDTALYSDIKGGGHPYFTGLAIAGGIYCFGLEGAIIGPVLLCCIMVASNLSSSTINSDQHLASIPSGNVSSRRQNRPLRRSLSTSAEL